MCGLTSLILDRDVCLVLPLVLDRKVWQYLLWLDEQEEAHVANLISQPVAVTVPLNRSCWNPVLILLAMSFVHFVITQDNKHPIHYSSTESLMILSRLKIVCFKHIYSFTQQLKANYRLKIINVGDTSLPTSSTHLKAVSFEGQVFAETPPPRMPFL